MNPDIEENPHIKGKTALITGASSGIGYELAKLFAKDGYNLVIIARDESMLKIAAEGFRTLGAPYVKVIPKDLSVPSAPAEIFEETELENLQIDVLINDAGVGEHGFFAEVGIDKDLHIIHLNIVALVHLTKLYLRDMLARRSGYILQLASLSAYQPTPLLSVYAATKAFVLSFTDSLINELRDTGVTVTALIPGATDTDFFNKAHAETTKAAYNKLASPAEVARAGYEGLMKGKHHAVASAGTKAQVVLSNILPNETLANMTRKQMEKK